MRKTFDGRRVVRDKKPLVVAAVTLAAVALMLVSAYFGLIAVATGEVPANPAYWRASGRFTDIEPMWRDGTYGFWFNCDVRIRSKEVPAFAQSVGHGVFLGWRPVVEGGIEDFQLLNMLTDWPRARRIAFLEYMASIGSPAIYEATQVDPSSWSNGYPDSIGLPIGRLYEIANRHGAARDGLVWVGAGSYDRGQLIGIDRATGGFVRLADWTYTNGGNAVTLVETSTR